MFLKPVGLNFYWAMMMLGLCWGHGSFATEPKSTTKPAEDAKPIQVFLLAGQSNMQGHGFVQAEEKR
ncbi:MAG TPA: hypothetical protein PKA06_12330, partial [Gemmatales bacterium]|nr:hypothetical protein [Gemmatales bacterium]